MVEPFFGKLDERPKQIVYASSRYLFVTNSSYNSIDGARTNRHRPAPMRIEPVVGHCCFDFRNLYSPQPCRLDTCGHVAIG